MGLTPHGPVPGHGADTADRAIRDDRSPSLWAGVLGPPVVWMARLTGSYVLVPFACAGPGMLPLHLLTLATLLATGWLGWTAWRNWQSAGGGTETAGAGPGGRTRFLALVGLGSSALFFLVIAAEGLANLLVHPCL